MDGSTQAAYGAGWKQAAVRSLNRLPPQSFFLASAIFHYLGPSFAVLLFARLDVLGVTWLRIVSAAVIFALWRRPWRRGAKLDTRARWLLIGFGLVLAAMNTAFYLAIARLPLSTVGAIEFLGIVLLAGLGVRSRRNVLALAITVLGVATITDIRLGGQPLGFVFAFADCILFMLYVMLGYRIANAGGGFAGIDRLGTAMAIAAVAVTPLGLSGALPAFTHPALLFAGIGVGLCSSVIPYVCDQLAMAGMPRATFALLLALLPVFATLIGAIVLRQIPTGQDLLGIGLVVAGVAIHQSPKEKSP